MTNKIKGTAFNSLVTFLIALFMTSTATAQNIQLPSPQKEGGLTFAETVANRHSIREFDPSKELSLQQISNLLWSAAGINRPETGMRSNPTAMNSQEIDVYLFSKDGVYLYDPKANALIKRADGDHRSLVAGGKAFSQDFVMDAPISLVMVADTGKFEREGMAQSAAPALDAGIVSQNINLFCSANGLATVPRITMDTDAIKTLLSLNANHLPLINNPVGYAK